MNKGNLMKTSPTQHGSLDHVVTKTEIQVEG